jgi:hypothetical protein
VATEGLDGYVFAVFGDGFLFFGNAGNWFYG